MTTLTKVPYDKQYIESYSKELNEPEWMTKLRLEGLDYAESLELPKPDKTNINRWNFTEFKHTSSGEKIDSLSDLPSQLNDFIDQENLPENLIILRNQSVAFSTLSKELTDKGDRKSTRLNSSHVAISYAVFC